VSRARRATEAQLKIDQWGRVEITVRVVDEAGVRSQHLKSGGKLYEMMFEHFPANGHQIKGWHGQFAWKNLEAVEDAIKAGATPKESVLKSITGKTFWKPWAEKNNLDINVKSATHNPGHALYFEVAFLPRGGG
jgi:hypothetical protein